MVALAILLLLCSLVVTLPHFIFLSMIFIFGFVRQEQREKRPDYFWNLEFYLFLRLMVVLNYLLIFSMITQALLIFQLVAFFTQFLMLLFFILFLRPLFFLLSLAYRFGFRP